MGYTLIEEEAPSGAYTLLPDAAPFTFGDYQDYSPAISSAMNVGQALTFGFGDEIAGMLGADKDRYRATVEKFRKDNPKAAMLGTVSGSMALPFGAAYRAASPWLTAATVGGAQGALQGMGDAPTVHEGLKDAGMGGAIGMAAGPALLGTMKPVGSVLGALSDQVTSRMGNARRLATNRVAEAFTRDAIDAGGAGLRMSELGQESRLVDAGGDAVRKSLDLNATLPGSTGENLSQAIESRIAGRPDRMDTIVNMVNGGYGRPSEVLPTIIAQKQAAASPLYQQLHSMDITANSALSDIVTSAMTLKAGEEARKIATASRVPFSLDPANKSMSMRDLDFLKQGLDKLIQKETAPDGAMSTVGRSYVGLQKDLIKQLDHATTDPKTGSSLYKSARDAFSGPAAMESAISQGRRFLSSDAESLGVSMSGMTSSEQTAFKIGASEALRNQFGGVGGQSRFLDAWKDRNVREKLKTLLGDDVKYSDVMKILDNERQMKKMQMLGRGSQTAGREAHAEDQTMNVAGDVLGMIGSAKTGALPTLLAGMGKYSARLGTPEPVRDEIGNILLGRGTAQLDAIKAAQMALIKRRALTSGLLGSAGGQAAQFFK